MGLNAQAHWVACYDIAERKRLARLFKLLKSEGVPLQYSVFLLHASEHELAQLEERIRSIIHPRDDDVRIYKVPSRSDIWTMGKSLVPDGMLLGEFDFVH